MPIAIGVVGAWMQVCAAFAVALEPIAAPAEDLRLGHPPPKLEPVDQTYLLRFARRVLLWRLREQRYDPPFVPPVLAELNCRVSISLRRQGRLLAAADSEPLPVLEACRAAAEVALNTARQVRPFTEADLDGLTIEIELIGPRERVGDGFDSPAGLARSFEPGLHGVAVRFDDEEILVRPSQILSNEPLCYRGLTVTHDCDRYLAAIEDFHSKLGLTRDPPDRDPASVLFLRFRSTHLFEPGPGAQAVELVAGLRFVEPQELIRPHVLATADDLARYIRHRQRADGLFAYEFLPGRDMYWPGERGWVRQAATIWSLAQHTRQRQDRASAEAMDRAISALAKMIQPLEGHRHAAYVATPDNEHPLGLTAVLCLATLDGPDPQRYADITAPLMNALAVMQQPSGGFRTNFPPATWDASQDYYPGEALLAIARFYARDRDAKWRTICDRALEHYRSYFAKRPPPAFIPWQVQAWGQMARTTRLQKYADFVYEMSDALATAQLHIDDRPLCIYDGGFDVTGAGRAGVATAVYVEGFIDAARTAQVMGDRQRAERYREIARSGARFVAQLRFRQEEGYYIQSPDEVIGAVRNTPADPTLRIDHCQHALMVMLGVAEFAPLETQPTARP